MIELDKIIMEDIDEDDSNHERKLNIYYASRLGYCMRQQYLDYVFPETDFSDFTKGVFKVGKMIHNYMEDTVINYCVRNNYTFEREFNVEKYHTKNFEIHGRADIIIYNLLLVIEFKSCSPNAFRYQIPKSEAIEQINYYMGQLKQSHVDYGQISYMEKYAFRVRDFNVTFNHELYDNSIEYYTRLNEHLNCQVLPERDFHFNIDKQKNRYPCTYCKHYHNCIKVKDGKIHKIFM